MRRLIAAGLVGLLASGLWYVWDEGAELDSQTLQQARVEPEETADGADTAENSGKLS